MHRYATWRVVALTGMVAASAMVAGAAPVHAASTTVTCGAKNIVHSVAPGVGKTTTVAAAAAGSVTLLQNAQTTLQVQSVAPASGWTDKVVAPSGTKVHVGFIGTPHTNQVRFDARLNPAGTKLTVVTVSCA
jgi:hypothetical protein